MLVKCFFQVFLLSGLVGCALAGYAAPAFYKAAPVAYAAPAYGKVAHAEDYYVSMRRNFGAQHPNFLIKTNFLHLLLN